MHRKSVYCLVLAVAVLLVIGSVMLFSTGPFAQDRYRGTNFYVQRQAVWMIIGGIACIIAANVDYRIWRRFAWPLYGVSVVLLLLCFVPHIGKRLNGSSRWIDLGFTFQPSELAKLAAVCTLAWWFSREETNTRSLLHGLITPFAIVGGLMALIAPEIDMGTTALLGAMAFATMFVAGTRLVFIVPLCVMGLGLLYTIAHQIGERSSRMHAFLDLERYKEGAGLQQWQALIAFGSGGVEGLGLGKGRQKMAYLPYAHTDFIFPMIGEELGLRFTLLVVFCFMVIILCGVLISMRARDRFGMLLGFGIVMLIALQAAVNIGVTTAMIPNKGLPLPFISYGGSNLVFCLVCVGILINIYRQGISEKEGRSGIIKLNAKTRRRPVRI